VKNLADLGERHIIELIKNLVKQNESMIGIGDDCAALDMGKEYLLLTTDMITKHTHISERMTAYQQGWFLVAINLSDLAAKGGKPLAVLIALGLPKNTSEKYVQDLIKGANDCAVRYGTVIAGGDTKENQTITLCGTAVGCVKKDEIMLRKGAQPGDVLAVTGTVGHAAAGYYELQQQKNNPVLLKGLFEPIPRIPEGQILGKMKVISSCMDSSDGLSSSLYQLQESNHLGFEIQKTLLPLSPNLSLLCFDDPYECALHFGGDYELLCTLPKHQVPNVQQELKKLGTSFTVIGSVTKDEGISLLSSGTKKVLPNKGYEHFSPHVFL